MKSYFKNIPFVVILYFLSNLSSCSMIPFIESEPRYYNAKDRTEYSLSISLENPSSNSIDLRLTQEKTTHLKRVKTTDNGEGLKGEENKSVVKRWQETEKENINLNDFKIIATTQIRCQPELARHTLAEKDDMTTLTFYELNPLKDYLQVKVEKKTNGKASATQCLNCSNECN